MSVLAPPSVHRDRPVGEELEVGAIELFFDLVYVFVIIQMSHHLLEHLTWTGALMAGLAIADRPGSGIRAPQPT